MVASGRSALYEWPVIRPEQADRLVEVGDVHVACCIHGKRDRGIQGRVRRRPPVPGVTWDSVPADRGDDPIDADPPNSLAEEVAEEEIARGIHGKRGDEAHPRLGGGSAVADIAVGRGLKSRLPEKIVVTIPDGETLRIESGQSSPLQTKPATNKLPARSTVAAVLLPAYCNPAGPATAVWIVPSGKTLRTSAYG